MLPVATLLRPPAALAASRRRFLVGAAVAGAGLTIGFGAPGAARAADDQGAPDTVVTPFEAYLRLAPDNTVTVLAAHLEMGQGPYTGTATLVAEELDADWSQMRAEGAWGNPKLYGNLAWGGNVQGTGGSTAMASSFLRYRKAGALARAMLVAAAAEAWHVPAAEIRVEKGVLSHPSGKRATMGELADAAARIGEETLAAMQPADDIPLKDPGDFALIGNPDLRRLDSVAKTTGAPVFTIDVRLPGMLTAVVAHPPRFGAQVKSFDAGGAKAVKAWWTWWRSRAGWRSSPRRPGPRSRAATRSPSSGTRAPPSGAAPSRSWPSTRPCWASRRRRSPAATATRRRHSPAAGAGSRRCSSSPTWRTPRSSR